MKREIKFRGKDESGKWLYGNFVRYIEDDDEQVTCIVGSRRNDVDACVEFIQVNDDTIGQFTGLYDKNGKEIYEGDVVKHPYVDPIFRDLVEMKDGKGVTSEVVFHDGAFVIKYDDDFIYLDAFTRHGYAEVIGNIHDKFDLL